MPVYDGFQGCRLSTYDAQDSSATIDMKTDNLPCSARQALDQVELTAVKKTVPGKYSRWLRAELSQGMQGIAVVYKAIHRILLAVAIGQDPTIDFKGV